MTEVDLLVAKKFVEFRENVVLAIKAKHPYVFGMMESVFSGKENAVGMQVTENGKAIGEYTFKVKGIHIVDTEIGKLAAEVRHPLLGLILKPYVVVEKSALEKIINDSTFMAEPFEAVVRTLPKLTIKFQE